MVFSLTISAFKKGEIGKDVLLQLMLLLQQQSKKKKKISNKKCTEWGVECAKNGSGQKQKRGKWTTKCCSISRLTALCLLFSRPTFLFTSTEIPQVLFYLILRNEVIV